MSELLLLPKDMQFEIMLRMPVKTLVILACVSKTFYNLITSPEFINVHLMKSKDNPLILFGYFRTKPKPFEVQFGLYPDNESSFKGDLDVKLIEVPKEAEINYCFNIVGCCNGVICLFDELNARNQCLMLWNPSIRKSIRLPCPSVDSPNGVARGYLGFGFDRVTNDLKVVRLTYLYVGNEPYPSELPPKVEVYTASSKSWRSIEGSGPMHKIYGRKVSRSTQGPYAQCFINGALHWAGYKERIPKGVWSAIVSFDMHHECFREMKFPARVEGCLVWNSYLMLTSCWDMLALVSMPRSAGESCIWVMKEYGKMESWMELYKFDIFNDYPRPRAFYFRKNKEILMLEGKPESFDDNTMLSIDYDKDHRKKLSDFEGPIEGTYLGAYEEGLALFKEGNSY